MKNTVNNEANNTRNVSVKVTDTWTLSDGVYTGARTIEFFESSTPVFKMEPTNQANRYLLHPLKLEEKCSLLTNWMPELQKQILLFFDIHPVANGGKLVEDFPGLLSDLHFLPEQIMKVQPAEVSGDGKILFKGVIIRSLSSLEELAYSNHK